jgi:hypothetical protein
LLLSLDELILPLNTVPLALVLLFLALNFVLEALDDLLLTLHLVSEDVDKLLQHLDFLLLLLLNLLLLFHIFFDFLNSQFEPLILFSALTLEILQVDLENLELSLKTVSIYRDILRRFNSFDSDLKRIYSQVHLSEHFIRVKVGWLGQRSL